MTDTLKYELKGVQTLRSRKGISLSWIARQTCISVRYLEAIEAQKWSLLPEGVYRVNYVRQYVEAIDPSRADRVAAEMMPRAVEAVVEAPVPFWRKLAAGLLSLL